MGEKIRDIHPIKIGGASLMIELNEGYSASQGRLIHIQNKKFRYLLTEKDFYHLSSMVLRAWREFAHIKESIVKTSKIGNFRERNAVPQEMVEYIICTTSKISDVNIDYRVLDVQDKLLTLLINPKDIILIDKLLKQDGAKAIHHPLGRKYGYRFLYQMEPFHLYKSTDKFIEIYFQLPCASLTSKTWIPLDKSIQSRIWDNIHEENGILYCDEISRYIFHLCWAIFHNKGFSPYEMEFLDSKKNLLSSEYLKESLAVVFFNYTPFLIDLLKGGKYDMIIPNYYSFKQY